MSSFDVVLLIDPRFPGGTSTAVAHEIRALAKGGYRIGLWRMRAPMLRRDRPSHPAIDAEVEAGHAVWIDPGADRVGAGLVVVHNPHVLEAQSAVPRIACERAVLVAHQPPLDAEGLVYYDARAIHEYAQTLFGQPPLWAPISTICRDLLERSGLGNFAALLEQDWVNVLFVEDWEVSRQWEVLERPVVGRHSRPDWPKWPASLDELLLIYPREGYEVRFLGVGEALERLLECRTPPPGWTLYRFGEMHPREFLAGLDFYVYFHHFQWIEGFGRNVAEAAASGLVPIVPRYMERTFGKFGAIYAEPHEVRAVLESLRQDPLARRQLGEMARRNIATLCAPERQIDLVRELLGSSAPAVPAPAGRLRTSGEPLAFDLVRIADMRDCGYAGWILANELRIEAEAGYRVGVIHAPISKAQEGTVHPEIDELVAEGAITPVPPDAQVRTDLLIVHDPSALWQALEEEAAPPLPHLFARRVVAVEGRRCGPALLRRVDALLRTLFRTPPLWSATDPEIAELLERAGLTMGERVWKTAVHHRPGFREDHPERVVRIGWAGYAWSGDWPADPRAAFGDDPGLQLRVWGWPRVTLPRNSPPNWSAFALAEHGLARFYERAIDVFAWMPKKPTGFVPHAVARCLVEGKPVVLPPELGPQIDWGPGVHRCSPERLRVTIDALGGDPETLLRRRREIAREARRRFGPGIHLTRLSALLGRPAPIGVGCLAVKSRPSARIVFVTTNGLGLGHLTRALAIARRLPGDVQPVVFTLSPAYGIVEQFGFPVEHTSYSSYTRTSAEAWNAWFAEQTTLVLDAWRPAAVVFDGGVPYRGFLNATVARNDLRLVWIRRGLWRLAEQRERALARQAYFDLVIEPEDLAQSGDRDGELSEYLHCGTVGVEPIVLFEPDELPERPRAREELGLPCEGGFGLIQLGSGANRDIAILTDAILEAIDRREGLEAVVAEWANARVRANLWPQTRSIRGFPLALYARAFDFTVAAAGYNTFHEVLCAGLPAVFVANEHPETDDQSARARFATENDAALSMPQDRPEAFSVLLPYLLDPDIAHLMRTNCSRLARWGGARQAADHIAALL